MEKSLFLRNIYLDQRRVESDMSLADVKASRCLRRMNVAATILQENIAGDIAMPTSTLVDMY